MRDTDPLDFAERHDAPRGNLIRYVVIAPIAAVVLVARRVRQHLIDEPQQIPSSRVLQVRRQAEHCVKDAERRDRLGLPNAASRLDLTAAILVAPRALPAAVPAPARRSGVDGRL